MTARGQTQDLERRVRLAQARLTAQADGHAGSFANDPSETADRGLQCCVQLTLELQDKRPDEEMDFSRLFLRQSLRSLLEQLLEQLLETARKCAKTLQTLTGD